MMTGRSVVLAIVVLVLTFPPAAGAADRTTVARGEGIVATVTATETPDAECGLCETAAPRLRIEGPGAGLFDDAFPATDGGEPYYVAIERLEIVRLDGGFRPDVLLHYLRPGAYCCSFVARWAYDGTSWKRTVHRLGAFNNAARLAGQGLLVGTDGRLDGVFEPHVASFEPLLVLGVRNDVIADITRSFPDRVRRSRSVLLREARKEPCLTSAPQAWVGDSFRLGSRVGERALRSYTRMTRGCPRGKASAKRVRRTLQRLGYLSRTPRPLPAIVPGQDGE